MSKLEKLSNYEMRIIGANPIIKQDRPMLHKKRSNKVIYIICFLVILLLIALLLYLLNS